MKEVGNLIKTIKDVKTDVESNLELGSKIKLWLDKKVDLQKVSLCLTSKLVFEGSQEDCTQEVLLQYPGSYPELYPEPRQTVFADVPVRSWDTVEKESDYNYVFLGLVGVFAVNYVFLGLIGILDVTNKFFEIEQVPRDPVKPQLIVVTALTTGNLPELSSQVRVLSMLVYLPLVEHLYNAAMQVFP